MRIAVSLLFMLIVAVPAAAQRPKACRYVIDIENGQVAATTDPKTACNYSGKILMTLNNLDNVKYRLEMRNFKYDASDPVEVRVADDARGRPRPSTTLTVPASSNSRSTQRSARPRKSRSRRSAPGRRSASSSICGSTRRPDRRPFTSLIPSCRSPSRRRHRLYHLTTWTREAGRRAVGACRSRCVTRLSSKAPPCASCACASSISRRRRLMSGRAPPASRASGWSSATPRSRCSIGA